MRRLIDPVLRQAAGNRPVLEWQLKRDWHLIVGPALATISAPGKLRMDRASGNQTQNTLELWVVPSWAAEIQHQIPMLMEKIAVYAGYALLTRIQIKQKPRLPSQTLQPMIYQPAAPNPTAIPATFRDAIQHLPSEEVQQALAALGSRIFGKGNS